MLSNYTQPPEVAVLYTHTHTHSRWPAGSSRQCPSTGPGATLKKGQVEEDSPLPVDPSMHPRPALLLLLKCGNSNLSSKRCTARCVRACVGGERF